MSCEEVVDLTSDCTLDLTPTTPPPGDEPMRGLHLIDLGL